MEIDLTKTELFRSFGEIEINDIYVDLHNDFECYEINYLKKESQLKLSFQSLQQKKNKIQTVEIVFKNISIEVLNFKALNSKIANWTLDNIYRGRFEVQDNVLSDVSNDGKYYYYLNFYDDYSFELFSNSVVAILM